MMPKQWEHVSQMSCAHEDQGEGLRADRAIIRYIVLLVQVFQAGADFRADLVRV